MDNGQQSAFACVSETTHLQEGLTKREYFAGLAMQGLLTRVPKREGGQVDLGIIECQRIAEESVIMADKLLESLKQPKKY